MPPKSRKSTKEKTSSSLATADNIPEDLDSLNRYQLQVICLMPFVQFQKHLENVPHLSITLSHTFSAFALILLIPLNRHPY